MKNSKLSQLLLIFSFLVLSLISNAQQSSVATINSNLIDLGEIKTGNQDFTGFDKLKPILKDVEIVMLGEQTHGDGAVFDTKVKLVKYLHKELGFDLLVFESGFYDCSKAWSEIQKGEDVEIALSTSIFTLWSTTYQFKPLTAYIDENKNSAKPLTVLGFDSQFTGPIANDNFLKDLRKFLKTQEPDLTMSEGWFHFQLDIARFFDLELRKKVKKSEIIKDTVYLNELTQILSGADAETMFWKQAIQSCKVELAGFYLGTNDRDKQMAQNLIWLKEQNPGKKIICWGATSHFLFNQEEIKMMKFPFNVVDNYYQDARMMGDYLKDEYGDKLFSIGFISYQGSYGIYSKKTMKPALENSLESVLANSSYINCLLPFIGLNLEGYPSRPLANQYMTTNITHVMDAVIFNRKMYPSYTDRNLLLEVFPTNKWIKPDSKDFVK